MVKRIAQGPRPNSQQDMQQISEILFIEEKRPGKDSATVDRAIMCCWTDSTVAGRLSYAVS
eukprot:scaffold10892_cov163-Amphora_coffeaeformis.AAC.10